MFKLLIVDDQKPVREGLKNTVKWNELSFEVVGDAESAEKALEIIEAKPIDVLLTDIVMAEMNGLRLIKEIKGINPYIKAVILSGYNEFQYAKEAIRLGAYDFLIKPVVFSELNRVFSEIKTVLKNEEQSRKSLNTINEVKTEIFLNNLAKGYLTRTDESYPELKNLGLDLSGKYYCVARLRILKSINNETSLDLPIEDIQRLKAQAIIKAKEVLDGVVEYYTFNNNIKEISFLLCFRDKSIDIDGKVNHLKIILHEALDCIVHIGLGKTYDTAVDINRSYLEAGKALEYSAIYQESHFQSFSVISEQITQKTSIIDEKIKDKILLFLTQIDKKGLIEYIENIINIEIQSKDASIKGLYETCIEILLIMSKYIYNFSESKKITKDFSVNIKEIYEKENINDIKGYILNVVDNLFLIIKENKESSAGLIIENVKKYIIQHYAEDISLIKLADIFYVHHTHLSRLFKEKTGENFIDYLTKVRIENAKKLLPDFSLKIYDIAEMVGYESPKYFSKTFKEYVGLTPAEYRNTMA